jgi:hypothetical protein
VLAYAGSLHLGLGLRLNCDRAVFWAALSLFSSGSHRYAVENRDQEMSSQSSSNTQSANPPTEDLWDILHRRGYTPKIFGSFFAVVTFVGGAGLFLGAQLLKLDEVVEGQKSVTELLNGRGTDSGLKGQIAGVVSVVSGLDKKVGGLEAKTQSLAEAVSRLDGTVDAALSVIAKPYFEVAIQAKDQRLSELEAQVKDLVRQSAEVRASALSAAMTMTASVASMKAMRESIQGTKGMDAETQRRLLQTLDEQIAAMEKAVK